MSHPVVQSRYVEIGLQTAKRRPGPLPSPTVVPQRPQPGLVPIAWQNGRGSEPADCRRLPLASNLPARGRPCSLRPVAAFSAPFTLSQSPLRIPAAPQSPAPTLVSTRRRSVFSAALGGNGVTSLTKDPCAIPHLPCSPSHKQDARHKTFGVGVVVFCRHERVGVLLSAGLQNLRGYRGFCRGRCEHKLG